MPFCWLWIRRYLGSSFISELKMWNKKIEKIDSRCFIVGNVDNPIYLIGKDDCWALIEGGCTYTFPIVLNQLIEIVGDLNKIQFFLKSY